MEPKKKSMFEIYLGFFLLIPILYTALIGAGVYTSVTAENPKTNIFTWLPMWYDALLTLPMPAINANTARFALLAFAAWLAGFASYTTSRKNYITNKEFGTAKWAGINEIKPLFAVNQKAAEIKKFKKSQALSGRVKAWNRDKKQAGANRGDACAELRQTYKYTKRDMLLYYAGKIKPADSSAGSGKPFDSSADKPKPFNVNAYVIYKENLGAAKAEWDKKIKAIKLRNYKLTRKQRKEKLEAINAKYENADMLFTKTERICMHNYVLNNNTLIIGGSGSGKTRGYAMPNILQAHSSYIITDPKGEILEKSGAFLKKKGYKIRVLNLDDKTASDCYNPFVYITKHKEGREERVLSLIETIIINTDGGEKQSSSDPFWEKGEKLFLQAIFFYVVYRYENRPEYQNMSEVMKTIQALEIAEERDKRNSTLDNLFEIYAKDFGEDNIGYQQFKEFRSKAAGKTAKSIVISAVARLAPFRLSEVKRVFETDDMGLDVAGEEKTAIFVVVPPTDKTLNFISGMLFTQLFQELQYCATVKHKHHGQRLPVPVRFILDEFANTCVIPNFVQILAYARSFGIGITVILQSLEQIKKMYEKEWGVVIDNCSTLLYLGSVSHMDTLEYMSKLLGKGTFDKKTSGRTFGKSGGSNQNFDKIGRELLDAAEIRKLPKEKCLFLVGGKNPFYSDKYDYTAHFNYRYTSDGGYESYAHAREPEGRDYKYFTEYNRPPALWT